MEFEWDIAKAKTKETKHGIKFEGATEIFADKLSSTVADPARPIDEDRFAMFGKTSTDRHLVVAFTERGDRIRIISARPMTRREGNA